MDPDAPRPPFPPHPSPRPSHGSHLRHSLSINPCVRVPASKERGTGMKAGRGAAPRDALPKAGSAPLPASGMSRPGSHSQAHCAPRIPAASRHSRRQEQRRRSHPLQRRKTGAGDEREKPGSASSS